MTGWQAKCAEVFLSIFVHMLIFMLGNNEYKNKFYNYFVYYSICYILVIKERYCFLSSFVNCLLVFCQMAETYLKIFVLYCIFYSECNFLHSERLKLHGEPVDLLPHVLLRKYIAYARKYVPSPRLSSAAAKVLQHFYLELRRQHQTLDATPVTTRQLESLIRLTQVGLVLFSYDDGALELDKKMYCSNSIYMCLNSLISSLGHYFRFI